MLLASALALSLTTFCRHRPGILTVASIVAHRSRVTAASSSRDDVDGSQLYPPAAAESVPARDCNGHGEGEREKVEREGDAALAARNVQQRYPPAYMELQKGIDLHVRIFYNSSTGFFLLIKQCIFMAH